MNSVPASTPISVPSPIRETARRLFVAHLDHLEDFPEEAWFSLSAEWRMKLYVDKEEAQCRATLHPVLNGEANHQVRYPVFPPFSRDRPSIRHLSCR